MTVIDLIELLIDLEEAGHGLCPVYVTTPRLLVELDAEAITMHEDAMPPYVRLDVR